MLNEKAARLYERGSMVLAVVNGGLLFAAGWQLHQLSLRGSAAPATLPVQDPGTIQALLSMPSLLFVLLTGCLLAVLIGKEWLRPTWIPLSMNLLWLVAASLLLQRLTALLA